MGVDAWGRQRIAVNQPPGGGSDYPFTQATDLSDLLADFYLAFEDRVGQFTPPFSIAWLQGFGANIVAPPWSPVHTYDLAVVDADGHTVFDSRDGDLAFNSLWGTRLRVLEWICGSSVVRAVQYLNWTQGEIDSGRSKTFDSFIEPTDAVLDQRTLYQLTPRVTSLTVEGDSAVTGPVIFQYGYNMALEPSAIRDRDGGRYNHRVTLAAEPGSGLGRYGPACSEADYGPVRRVAGQAPDAAGNFLLDAGGCYRVEQPMRTALDTSPPTLQARRGAIQVANDAEPCCTTDDYINVYEAIRAMRDRLADLSTRAHIARDLYVANLARFNDQQAVRATQAIRVLMQPTCPDEILIAVGYCHQGPECLRNLVIVLQFDDYTDSTGYMDPYEPALPLHADTTYPGVPEVIDGSVYKQGDVARRPRCHTPSTPEPYTLGGQWPHYFAVFEQVQPGHLATVSLRLHLSDSVAADTVELVTDAYAPADLAQGTPAAIPVPGYVAASGPVGADAKACHLVTSPRKDTSGVLGRPCTSDESDPDPIENPPE